MILILQHLHQVLFCMLILEEDLLIPSQSQDLVQ